MKRIMLYLATLALVIGNLTAANLLVADEGTLKKCTLNPSPFLDHCQEVCEGTFGSCGGDCEVNPSCA